VWCHRDVFGDVFTERASAECEEGYEAVDSGCMRGACAVHDDGDDVDFGTWQLSSEGVCELGVFITNKLCGVREVEVSAVFPFSNLNFFI
jgi:hypothetical protein